MKFYKLTIISALILFVLNITPSFADYTENFTDMGPYIPYDGISRKKVVTYAERTTIPAAFTSRVTRTYPDGRFKAVIITSDDSPSANDINFIIPTLKANGLTAAFNTVGKDAERASAYPGLFDGMEVGNHTYNHVHQQSLNKEGHKYEIGYSKYVLEETLQKEVAGYIVANNEPPAPDQPTNAWRIAYLKYTGHRYLKQYQAVSNPWTGSVSGAQVSPDKLNYSLPADLYNWLPTMELQVRLENGATPDEVCDYYVDNYPENNQLSLLFYNTHGNGGFNAGSDYRTFFTNICEKLSASGETVWNVTPIDYADYMNAMWNITFADGGDDSVTATNTSGGVDIWLTVNGVNMPIPAGKAVTVSGSGNITDIKDVRMIYGLPQSRELFEPLNPHILVDGGTATVSVEGKLETAFANTDVSLVMIPANADPNNLTVGDLKYIWQEKVDSNGAYKFKFTFNGITYDKNGIADNYKILVNHGGKNVTPTVTGVSADRKLVRYSWNVTSGGGMANALLYIDNSIGRSQPYRIMIACYTGDNRLLDVKLSDSDTIATGLNSNRLSIEIPDGTTKVKAFVTDGLKNLIPLAISGGTQITNGG
jgi:peptidoglycan/xylan/chitin deacetylase (PgdA/CDA1 family)